jgi:two-component system, response regulator PdtaR
MNLARTAESADIEASAAFSPGMEGVMEPCVTAVPEPKTPLRVLIVEDEPLIGMLLGEMLEVMGYEVCAIEATESGAVSAAARCKPGLMIVDAQLREGNGISAVDTILAQTFIPHIFVSGNRRGVLKVRPNSVVVEKPFTEAVLADAITRARGKS